MTNPWKPAPEEPSGLLLKVRRNADGGFAAAARELTRGAEPLLKIDEPNDDTAFGPGGPATWFRIDADDKPWDQAHAMMRMGFAVGTGDLLAAEPDFEQQWVSGPPAGRCAAEPQDGGGGRAVGPGPRWHLGAGFSGLADARSAVSASDQARVLVAHLDTGYDPRHQFGPATIAQGQRNFVRGEGAPDSAEDVTPAGGGVLRNRGHGTGTIGILAGPEIGGAPGVSVLPIRIADSVVRFRTGTMAQGFEYALERRADILSMSMGGLASAILADAVNKAYAAGMVMVTAAGNNYAGLPVRSIVYPARMCRVVAACGIMANMKSYSGLRADTMEGCYGPASKMASALSGFTPNIPWPELGCVDVVDEDGQGTSAATPQLAAAAALWIARYRDELDLLTGWRRGEAVRQALFRSASLASRGTPDLKLGWGAVRASAMLSIKPSDLGALVEEQRATAAWAWLKMLTGRGTGFAAAGLQSADRLLGLELVQLAQRDPSVAAAVTDPDADVQKPSARKRLLEAAEASPLASHALRAAAASALRGRTPRKPLSPPPAVAEPAVPPNPVPAPERRRLNIYALDPSLGGALNSYEDQIAKIEVRNEKLMPGPVGEYVEVVDVDPASNRFYLPVDLENVNLLKQDGATPSEGDPAFHQQMVYAVAMRTIEHFELALGRKALWGSTWSGKTGDDNVFVRRLRIYPHALRQQNAYYSPDRKALLFGYFPANSTRSDVTPPGTMVFSCLSADIVAHETTHALLDGQSRTFSEASNPDVRAFHEAFADITALFQQFTYRDLVRRQIARHRGDLSASALLGGLARQFGEGTGRSGPLRRYPEIDPSISYETSFDTHERGSLLVAAVYRAFLAIVARRTSDLIRVATLGSGVLPEGALHPDLVERLADETTKAAGHVLTMCIRAIDYTPPVDITFGEYLRAIITADMEAFPTDELGYRVAFLESFRKAQLLPRSLRTVSADTLRWRRWDAPQPGWLGPAIEALDIDFRANLDREAIFRRSEAWRETLRVGILRGMASQRDCDDLGLEHRLKYFRSLTGKGFSNGTTFMVDNVRVSRRVGPDGDLHAQLVAVVRQKRPEALRDDDTGAEAERFWFRGGTTLIVDLLAPGGPRIAYSIRKPILSPSRLARERAYRSGDEQDSLRAMYFGGDAKGFLAREPFALMHAERGR